MKTEEAISVFKRVFKRAAAVVLAQRDVAFTRDAHGIITEELLAEMDSALCTLTETIERETLERAALEAERPSWHYHLNTGRPEGLPYWSGEEVAARIRALLVPSGK